MNAFISSVHDEDSLSRILVCGGFLVPWFLSWLRGYVCLSKDGPLLVCLNRFHPYRARAFQITCCLVQNMTQEAEEMGGLPYLLWSVSFIPPAGDRVISVLCILGVSDSKSCQINDGPTHI